MNTNYSFEQFPVSVSKTSTNSYSIVFALMGLLALLGFLLLIAWYFGAFSGTSWVESTPVTKNIPASWCYVGTDDGKRICLKVPTPTACGDITVYASESSCVQQKTV